MSNKNVLIKPVSGSCNMRCKYCFYMDETQNREVENYGFMSDEVLEQIIRQTIESSDTECTISYQGGEPTLRGLEFFQKSILFQKLYNTKKIKINNAIQTNGYAIDDEWISFLRENHFLVGVSLDGNTYTHDFNRVDASGNGTHQIILDTIHKMDAAGVEYNILTVVNAQTAKKISSIYEFYKQEGFDFLQFIPCLNPFGKEKIRFDYTLTPKLYSQFLKTLFDCWYQDIKVGKVVHIQQFENYVLMIQGKMPGLCGMGGICSMQNVIEADGEVYPCDFYVLDEFKLGNLAETSFEKINQRRLETNFVQQSMNVPEECRQCKYQGICRNGCRRNREIDAQGICQKNVFCQSYREFFEYAGARLQELAHIFR